MASKSSPNMMPVLYSHRIHDIQAIGRSCGYALAIHGSMQRDLDIVAIPWTKKSVKAETLIKRLCEGLNLMYEQSKPPTVFPHGRRAWSLHFKNGGAGYMDLSVMPLVKEE